MKIDFRPEIERIGVPCASMATVPVACGPEGLRTLRLRSAVSGALPALFLPDVLTDLPSAVEAAGKNAAGFDVTVCELPGHGMSARLGETSLAAFAERLARLVDRQMPAGHAFAIIGEGFGALLALEVARLRPERVSEAILFDMPVVLTRPGLAHRLAQRWRADPSLYRQRLLREIYGVEPLDGSRSAETPMWELVEGIDFPCTILANDPLVATDDDLADLYEANDCLLIHAWAEGCAPAGEFRYQPEVALRA